MSSTRHECDYSRLQSRSADGADYLTCLPDSDDPARASESAESNGHHAIQYHHQTCRVKKKQKIQQKK
jgi:hypothetical protein